MTKEDRWAKDKNDEVQNIFSNSLHFRWDSIYILHDFYTFIWNSLPCLIFIGKSQKKVKDNFRQISHVLSSHTVSKQKNDMSVEPGLFGEGTNGHGKGERRGGWRGSYDLNSSCACIKIE
jgi:hypothetical protein